MKLIKKLDRRKNITGNNYSSWGLFLCPYCESEVEKILHAGIEAKSCGCMQREFIKNALIGKKHTEEHNKKISNSTAGVNNPMYGVIRKGVENPFYGKKHTEDTKKRQSEIKMGLSNGMYGKKHTEEAKQKNSDAHKGKKHTEEVKQKIRESRCIEFGENSPNWQGGISFEEYPQEFNK